MPKTGRFTGPSNDDAASPPRRRVQIGGTDVELSGSISDFHVGGTLRADGDLDVRGVLKTGDAGTVGGTFGGIEREARYFSAGEMLCSTQPINFGDGVPRINMPRGVQTDVYALFEVEEWWLDSTIGVYFEWVNDHTATGNVRWDCEVKEYDIATETLAAADSMVSRTFTQAAPAANTSTTGIVSRVGIAEASFDPGPFMSFYVLRISRLGDDAEDTLDGPVGLVFANMTRGQ